jgi:hypothetical protein
MVNVQYYCISCDLMMKLIDFMYYHKKLFLYDCKI